MVCAGPRCRCVVGGLMDVEKVVVHRGAAWVVLCRGSRVWLWRRQNQAFQQRLGPPGSGTSLTGVCQVLIVPIAARAPRGKVSDQLNLLGPRLCRTVRSLGDLDEVTVSQFQRHDVGGRNGGGSQLKGEPSAPNALKSIGPAPGGTPRLGSDDARLGAPLRPSRDDVNSRDPPCLPGQHVRNPFTTIGSRRQLHLSATTCGLKKKNPDAQPHALLPGVDTVKLDVSGIWNQTRQPQDETSDPRPASAA